jgi:hypothetical protein
MGNRPKVRNSVLQDVLLRSRRRCCLCFGLEFDLSLKNIQIAHLDRNASNNMCENLVALCLEHHDEYDTVKRQTKSLTAEEVKVYREKLYDVLEQKNKDLILAWQVLGQRTQSELTSGLILGQIVQQFDRDWSASEGGQRVNGMSMAHLAQEAIWRYGDFAAAREALLSLLRIYANEPPTHFFTSIEGETIPLGFSYHHPQTRRPKASNENSLMRILITTYQADADHGSDAIKLLRLYALKQDKPFTSLGRLEQIPSSAFGSVVTILAATCHEASSRGEMLLAKECATALMDLLFGVGVALGKRGIGLPSLDPKIFIRAVGCYRWIEHDELAVLLWAQLANLIAELPDEPLKASISREYIPNIFDIGIDFEQGCLADEGRAVIDRWSVIPSYAMVCGFTARTEAVQKELTSYLASTYEIGKSIAAQSIRFVEHERQLIAANLYQPI